MEAHARRRRHRGRHQHRTRRARREFQSVEAQIFVTFDATDGLGRDKDARELREAGRSIAEPAIQHLYRTYVTRWVQAIRPDYIGLGAETNLVRLAAPRSIYDGLKARKCRGCDVRAVMPDVPLYTTVQVDVAWGRLQGTSQYTIGVEEDFRDFPFAQVLGRRFTRTSRTSGVHRMCRRTTSRD